MKLFYLLIFILFFTNATASNIKLTEEEKTWLKENNKINLLVDHLKPLSFINEEGEIDGITTDYKYLLEKALGKKDIINLVMRDSLNDVHNVNNKNIHGFIPIVDTPANKKDYNITSTFGSSSFIIFGNKDIKNTVNSLKDLSGKSVAILKKHRGMTRYFSKINGIELVYANDVKEQLSMLQYKKVDYLVGYITYHYLINENLFTNITEVYTDKNVVKTGIGIYKEYPIIYSILNKAVKKGITPTNRLAIFKKWNIYPTEKNNKFNLTKEEQKYLKQKERIKICVLPDWLPFEQIDENTQHKGIGADILKILSKKLDKEFILIPTKMWSESLENIRNRKCDILPVAMNVPSRRDVMNFTKPYVKESFVIATSSDKFFIRDIDDLSGKKIGIVKSYAIIEVLKTQNPLINVIEVKNTKEGLEKVSKGELYGYVDTMPTIGYFIQKHGYFDLKIAGKLSSTIDLSIASRNDEPLLNSILQKTLNTISPEEIRTIVGRWIKINVQQEFDYKKLIYIIMFFSIILLITIYKNRSISSINKKLHKEQKTIESLVRFQESLLSLFDKGDAVLFKWNISNKSNLEFISQSIYSLTEYTHDEFISEKVDYTNCIHKDDLPHIIKKNKKALKSMKKSFKHDPYRIITKNGAEKWVLDYRIIERNKDGSLYILGYISNITEHIDKQEKTSHQEKMISLGEMIGNIAHQWRQPLSLISSIATGSVLKKELDMLSDNEFKEGMKLINDNTQYLSKTIDDFRNFIKGQSTLTKFNLSEKIDEFLNLMHPSIIANNVKVIKEYDTSLEIENYPNDLIQSLINIYNNSKDALKDIPETERYFVINTLKIQDEVKITLKDNAGGIEENMLNKIFEPYTTTKHQSQGTGLGMNITYNFVVTGMKGYIAAQNCEFIYENKKYKGAEITITLPLK